MLTPTIAISLLYQEARSQPAMPDSRTGIATSFVSSQHNNSNNRSPSNSVHLNNLKRRSHLSSNPINNTNSNSNNRSNNNKEFHRQHFHNSQWTNKRNSAHNKAHRTNRTVVATNFHLLVCAPMAKRSSKAMFSVALHSALLMARKRKAVGSRRNFRSARPAMRQRKPNKPR